MNAGNQPTLVKGGVAFDDRGSVSFVNDFDLAPVRRFYVVRNHEPGFVRAWHAHREEAKFITAVEGKQVTLTYEEHQGVPSSCFGETGHFVTGVRAVNP